MKQKKKSLKLFVFLCLTSLYGMGNGTQNGARVSVSPDDPVFIELDEGEDSFEGEVKDNNKTTKIKDISFAGVTKLAGVRTEHDDSVSTLSLSSISSFTVLDPKYENEKLSSKNPSQVIRYIKVRVKSWPSNQEGEYLLPYKIMLCGQEVGTDIQKAWWFKDISHLTINHTKTASMHSRKKKEMVNVNVQEAPLKEKVYTATSHLVSRLYARLERARSWLASII